MADGADPLQFTVTGGAAATSAPSPAPPPSSGGQADDPLQHVAHRDRSILGTSWKTPGVEAWDVPGGGALPEVQPQPGVGGFSRYVDTSLTPSPNAGDYVPLSRDPATGNLRMAVPNIIRGLTTEGPQLNDQGKFTVPGATIDPGTGTLGVTPQALLSAQLGSPSALRWSGPPGVPPAAVEMHAVDPPALPPVWKPNLQQAEALNNARWDAIRDNAGAAVRPDYAGKGLQEAIKNLQPPGPLTSATAGSGPTGQLAVRLQGAVGKPITLGDFAAADSDLGGQISQQYTSGNPNTGRILRGVQADLRNHFENAGPDDVVGGQEGFDALDPARQTNTQVQKMRDINDMIYKATLRGNAGGNEGGSMRSLLGNYLAGDASRNLTDMERAAAEAAQKRGPVSVGLDAAAHIASPLVGGLLGGFKGAMAAEGTRTGLRTLSGAVARARVQGLLDTLGQGIPPP